MSITGRADIDNGSFFVNFNQDCTSLSVGTKRGFSLFSLASVGSILEEIHHAPGEDVCLVERLFSSSLVAVVSLNSPRKLRVCHFKKGTEICNYSYSNTILGIKLNRSRMIVCLEESLYIHNIRDMKVVHTIRDTPPNPAGLMALATSETNNCYLAYPGSARTGEVQIFDTINLNAKTMIAAHESPLAAIAFSPAGTELATASEKGTVIRVFSVHDGSKLFEFRRGVKRCVSIASLTFSTCSKYLCCSSNTETVHIFELQKLLADCKDNSGNGASGSGGNSSGNSGNSGTGGTQKADDWMGYISKTVSSYLPLALPSQVADVFTQGRAFASALLPTPGVKHYCVVTTIERSLMLLVASQNGYLYVYQIPEIDGGDCRLVIKHDLRDYESIRPQLPRESQPVLVPKSSSPAAGGGSSVSGSAGSNISGGGSGGNTGTGGGSVGAGSVGASNSYATAVKTGTTGTNSDDED